MHRTARRMTFSLLVSSMVMAEVASGHGDLPLSARDGAWVIEDSVRTYTGEALFDLIDGGAPLYFEYGFIVAHTARYHGTHGGTVAAEVYQMRSEGGAYGLFSYLSTGSGTPAVIGQRGVAGTGFVLSWQGRQVWSFTALDSTSGDSVIAIARELTGPPPYSWRFPAELDWFAAVFPEARDRVLCFGPLGFQKRPLSLPDRVLLVRRAVSGVLPEGEVVVVEYSSGEEASMRRDSLVCSLGFSVPAAHQLWEVHSWEDRELLVARWERRLIVVRGHGRDRLRELWGRVQHSEPLRGH